MLMRDKFEDLRKRNLVKDARCWYHHSTCSSHSVQVVTLILGLAIPTLVLLGVM